MEGKWPCTYLGVPLHVGRMTIRLFEPLLLKLQKKLAGWKSNILSFGGKIILLKHVLSSMPIHVLSVMNLPKGVFKAIKSIFSNFIWNSTDDKRKRKWNLHDVQKSLFMKFAWKLLEGNSVWAKFFLKKYVGGKHPMALYNSTGSRFWKGILSVMPIVQHNSCFLIRSGACNFWFDNWLGDGAIANTEEVSIDENLLVADILNSSGWDVVKLHLLVSEEMVEKIIASPVQILGGSDVRIWKPNPDGNFSTKSAWHLIREIGTICLWKKWLWHSMVPKKMSFVCWRAKKHVLPVDDIISKLGIPLASKCHCCVLPQQESIDHILCSGELAAMVWRYFADVLVVRLPNLQNWTVVMNVWWFRASESSQVSCCRGILPIIITWALWRARCEHRMEGKISNWRGVVRRIKLMLIDIFSPHRKFDRLHANDIKVLQELNCPFSHVREKSMKAIAWSKPNVGQYKLNVDGNSLRNPGLAGGGGVIRDHDGRVLAGFSIHYGQVSNTVAEGRALLDGLKLAQQLGIRDILVESDSDVIVKWIQAGKCSLWYLWDFWDDI
ncbi:hypothetical protein CIPAW_04G137600 [Carya illinoinensis]|uniref:RNase H type-1 domain-containing protein n=1 Tax=Carya illinoinensis TaxID=32201 RepID=A0A8T1QUL8_CARIL|nr:hypothetical protein CIPAW_04G137600 [Carya illinoinensis]